MEDEGVFTTITQKYDVADGRITIEIVAAEGSLDMMTDSRETSDTKVRCL